MASVRAYIDDSGKELDSPTLVLAGYLSTVEKWALFDIEWRQILIEHSLTSFYMVEAWRLGKNYRKLGALRRDSLILQLLECINRSVEFAFVLSINMDAYRHWFARKEHPDIRPTRSYFFAYSAMVTMIADYIYNNRYNENIEVIFDEPGGESIKHTDLIFELMQILKIDHKRELMGIPKPIFMSDTEALPLQAADMLAWLVRRVNFNHITGKETKYTAEWFLLNQALQVPKKIRIFDEAELKAMSIKIASELEGEFFDINEIG